MFATPLASNFNRLSILCLMAFPAIAQSTPVNTNTSAPRRSVEEQGRPQRAAAAAQNLETLDEHPEAVTRTGETDPASAQKKSATEGDHKRSATGSRAAAAE